MKYILPLLLLVFFNACSIKMDTHNYSDGTSSYDDEVGGMKVKLLLDDGLCIRNGSTLKKGSQTIKLTLTKWCKLIGADKYINNQFVESVLNNDNIDFIENYVKERKELDNKKNLFLPQKRRKSNTSYYYGTYRNILSKSPKCFDKGIISLRTKDNINWLGEFKYYTNSKLLVYQIQGLLDNEIITSKTQDIRFTAKLKNEFIKGNYYTDLCEGDFEVKLVK
ncbi:MAG: hypothetical protein COA66_07825 [Arcobacter sp.]|nr:MAG: hypothetical protein COA66_07825 [Arcobacter sp.]